MHILFASQNKNKITEAQRIFANSSYHLVDLNQPSLLKGLGIKIPANLRIEETANTFAENAIIKAQAFYELSKLPCIADDSGLVLDAFPNFPGVNSNRWCNGSDTERNLALLKKLKNNKNRQAKFQTVLCLLAFKKDKPLFFSGEVTGKIAFSIRGKKGFAYDPIFIPNGYTATFAELGLAVKNKISHRARAWKKLMNYLQKN
jgi:XTP/dITP diphosphohydrolase